MDLIRWAGASVGPLGGAGPPKLEFEALLGGPAICGSPAEVTDKLLAIREAVGVDLQLAMMDLGGMPEAEVYRAIDLLGAKVLPELAEPTA
jgi:alkanesulfonate monooxygenase SsuD/methylene tetrahydromethanopterin reductase-like flavin-dependent oxidoreductase (luciferase family)